MQATLSWIAPVGQPVTPYNLYRSTTPNIPANATPVHTGITSTSFVDTRLRNRRKHYYRVAGVNSAGVGR